MLENYIYLFIGIILGGLIALYYFIAREEKIEKKIMINQKMYSTQKLDETMKKVVDKINNAMKRTKKELTEEEKNEIIIECYKENFRKISN